MFQSAEFGKIVFDNRAFNEDVVVRSNGSAMPRGPRPENHEISWEEMKHYIDDRTRKVIVGTGFNGVLKVLQQTKEFLSSRGIELVEVKTQEAIKLYNEERDKNGVVAVIHSTC